MEIVIPELHEMRLAHLISIGSESISSLYAECEDGYALHFEHQIVCTSDYSPFSAPESPREGEVALV